MSLVPYDDSSSEDEAPARTAEPLVSSKRKSGQSPPLRKIPPPLPSSFSNLYSSKSRSGTTDDPALHNGRIRQIPHVAGNWSAHVYLEWTPEETAAEMLEAIIDRARKSLAAAHPDKDQPILHSFLLSDLKARLPLHVSLSAPLVLTTTERDLFQADLKEKVTKANLEAFTVHPVALKWVSNFDNTRTFLVVVLSRPKQDTLNRLLDVCNKVCAKHGQPSLYKICDEDTTNAIGATQMKPEGVRLPDRTAKFHISIAWTLIPKECLSDTNLDIAIEQMCSLTVSFDTVLVRMGNSVEAVPLDHDETLV